MNNSDSVPARIVIVGTSKLRLSERFNRIQNEKTPQQQIIHKEEVLSVNGGPLIERPRIFNRPSKRVDFGSKSFLHDEYMDNNLYGKPAIHMSATINHMRRSDYAYNDAYNELIDPVKLSLDDYDTYQRTRPPRSLGTRFGNGSSKYKKIAIYGQEESFYDEYDLAHAIPSLSRSNHYNQPFRKPIQQRLSYKPRISDFALRRPIRNMVIFKRSFRGRFNGSGRRFLHWSGGRNGRGQFRNSRWNEKQFKKSVHELDRELDEYMKSGKHPRVQLAN